MPIYCYRCRTCGHAVEEYQSMRDDAYDECPACGSREYGRVVPRVSSPQQEFATPIEMYSIGLSDEAEIREFKRRCPDVDVSADPRDPLYGVPVARSRAQKLAALQAVGFEERG